MNKTAQKKKETMAGMLKYSYMVSCASTFKKEIEELATRQNVTAGELARAALLLAPPHIIENATDPGDAPADDREIVILKSGTNKGRKITRKPRIQVRLTAGYDVEIIRRALGFALSIDQGGGSLFSPQAPSTVKAIPAPTAPPPEKPAPKTQLTERIDTLEEQAHHFQKTLDAVAFTPLPMGVRTRHDALYVLGFKSTERPTQRVAKERYKKLARIFHPDSVFGDHQRMSQLNDARNLLAKRPFSMN
ncbi:MAG: J domain-containing protein [Alphaproteobacteria bacterium]